MLNNMVGGLRGIGSLKNIVKPNLKVELEGVDVVPVVCVVLSANLGGKKNNFQYFIYIFKIVFLYLYYI
jgi:hypothetical protein